MPERRRSRSARSPGACRAGSLLGCRVGVGTVKGREGGGWASSLVRSRCWPPPRSPPALALGATRSVILHICGRQPRKGPERGWSRQAAAPPITCLDARPGPARARALLRAAGGPARPLRGPALPPPPLAAAAAAWPARRGPARRGLGLRVRPPRRALGSGAAPRPPPSARAGQRPRPLRLAAAACPGSRRAGLEGRAAGAAPPPPPPTEKEEEEAARAGPARRSCAAWVGARAEPAGGGVIAPRRAPPRPSPRLPGFRAPDLAPRKRAGAERAGQGPAAAAVEHTMRSRRQ